MKKVTTERDFDSVFKLDLNYGKISNHSSYKVSFLGLCQRQKKECERESLKEDKCTGKENEEEEPETSSHCLMITHGAAHESLIIYLKENGDVLRYLPTQLKRT